MRGRLSRTLWIVSALFIVYGSAIPFNFTTDRAFAARKLAHVSLNPLISSDTGRRVSIPDVVQNILLFVPFGVFGVLSSGRRRGTGVGRIILVTILAAALGVAVESMQLFTLDRVTSLTDVISETTGAFCGAVAAVLTWRTSTTLVDRLARLGMADVGTFYPLLVASVGTLVAAWEPFDVTLDVGSFVARVRALQHDVWQAGVLSDEIIAVTQYALFAMALAEWLRAHGRRDAAAVTALVGLVVAFGLESSQFVIWSRMPSLEDACVRGAGVILGLLLWPLVRTGSATGFWLAVLTVATAAGAAMQQLSPFTIAPAYRHFQWFPFLAAYTRTRFETLSHDIELLLTYFPLGFCFAWVQHKQSRTYVAALVITLAIAAPVEYFQGWIIGRYPDVTDVGLSLVGGCFGLWAGSTGARLFANTRGRTDVATRLG